MFGRIFERMFGQNKNKKISTITPSVIASVVHKIAGTPRIEIKPFCPNIQNPRGRCALCDQKGWEVAVRGDTRYYIWLFCEKCINLVNFDKSITVHRSAGNVKVDDDSFDTCPYTIKLDDYDTLNVITYQCLTCKQLTNSATRYCDGTDTYMYGKCHQCRLAKRAV